MSDLIEARRREATWAFIRYFALGFVIVSLLAVFTAYALLDARAQKRESRAIRVEYCTQLETLKAQNRDDVADDKRHYKRNLRLLGLKDTPELRKAVEAGWARKLRLNAPKSCPYHA